ANSSDFSLRCWSELIGYPCCSSNETTIYAHDDYGDWGYDFHKKEWCGLTLYKKSSSINDNICWSEEFGYPCCIGCSVYEKDSNGAWGYEFNQWCGI
ncbi:Non-catalytic module family DOC2, partial [Piromyces sp. E2]